MWRSTLKTVTMTYIKTYNVDDLRDEILAASHGNDVTDGSVVEFMRDRFIDVHHTSVDLSGIVHAYWAHADNTWQFCVVGANNGDNSSNKIVVCSDVCSSKVDARNQDMWFNWEFLDWRDFVFPPLCSVCHKTNEDWVDRS